MFSDGQAPSFLYYILQNVGSQLNVGNLGYNFIMKDNVFGAVLRTLRKEMGLSQRELGEKLGFCNQTVSFWESGQREPDLDALVALSKFFQVTADYLLGLE